MYPLTPPDDGWFALRFARLSTAIKMLLILSLGLFPLGLIAILASIESARDNSARKAAEVTSALEIAAQRLDSAIGRAALTIRAAGPALAAGDPSSNTCALTLARLARAQAEQWRYALFARDGSLRCASRGYVPDAPPPRNLLDSASAVEIAPDGSALLFTLYRDDGGIEGSGEFSRESLEQITRLAGGAYDLTLIGDARSMTLHEGFDNGPLIEAVEAVKPVLGGRLRLGLRTGASRITAPEVLVILLPVLMWIAAATIGWVILDRLLLRPLARMQRAVAGYRPGDRGLDLPMLSTPAREIGELGYAFHRVAQTVARHEAELEAGIERQTRLVREVHHRVKNNLQVIASLINLHARGAGSDEVAAAYASIQRRVDALAVVHRNHFAEVEDNRGVSLKALISELCANLRATAPAAAAGMVLRLDVDNAHVTQDIAVSVAFLLTEMVEFAMLCEADAISVCLDRQRRGLARLTVDSDALRGEIGCDPARSEQFERIVTGLSRQLRSTLHRDPEAGRYALDVTILDRGTNPPTPGMPYS